MVIEPYKFIYCIHVKYSLDSLLQQLRFTCEPLILLELPVVTVGYHRVWKYGFCISL
mgnify:CR=1 FL=1